MAQTLDEQVAVVERALGECMIETALVVVRSWLNEIGENNPYEEAFVSLQQRYRDLFTKWLNVDDPGAAEELTKLTGDAYQLVDAVYADIRLARGLSPSMHGFNPDSIESVMRYFENSVRLRPEDLAWFHDVINSPDRPEMGVIAVTALAHNLRTNFSIDVFLALIEGMTAENELAADMCIAQTCLLLVQYDVRIDFFPQIQDAFADTIATNDLGEHVFDVLCAIMRGEKVLKMIPGTDSEYVSEVLPLIAGTWLYAVLIEGSTSRERMLAYHGVQAGYREMMWGYPDVAEQVYLQVLRGGTDKPQDYINYAHCLLLQGDRMMAFENYKQARQLCGSSKEFFALFRPDRRQLVDHGVPMEHVYLLEDQLVQPDK